jgi:predicted nucleotidyltransferase
VPCSQNGYNYSQFENILETFVRSIGKTTPPPQLVELLFGAYRRSILSLLLLHPEQSFYVREMGRLTGVPAGSLHREVSALAEAGLLDRSTGGNQIRYQANPSHPIYAELAGIFRKTAGLADVLRQALSPLGKAVQVAFVFGSVAQGKERATSDVDVMVIGSAGFERMVKAFAPAGKQLRRDVNPVVMTLDQFRSKLGARDRFVSRIMREPKIILTGDIRELGQSAQDRAA